MFLTRILILVAFLLIYPNITKAFSSGETVRVIGYCYTLKFIQQAARYGIKKQTLEKFNEMMLAAFYLNQCKRLNVYVPGLLIKKHFDEIDENTQQHLELWEVKIGFEKQNIFIFLDGPKAKKKGLLV